MRYDRVFTKLFCQPVLLEPSFRVGLEMALFALMRGEIPATPPMVRKIDPDTRDAYASMMLEMRSTHTAIIHIDGAIDKNLSGMDRISFDATDLNDVDRAIAQVRSDPMVQNVMLAINSPGGTVPGVPETAARIAQLAAEKNTFAYVDGACCSAAYWLASQCDQIFAPQSSSSGSVGVYCAIIDQSRRMEDMGIAVETIQDGKLKTAGAPWKPLTKSERAHLQDRVNQIGEMFRRDVMNARPGLERDAMEGQSFLGPAAREAGLIDGLVSSLDEAIAQF
jgi:signal peptide peptidase SppA